MGDWKYFEKSCYNIHDICSLFDITKPKCMIIPGIKEFLVKMASLDNDEFLLRELKYILSFLDFYDLYEENSNTFKAMIIGRYAAVLAGSMADFDTIDVWVFINNRSEINSLQKHCIKLYRDHLYPFYDQRTVRDCSPWGQINFNITLGKLRFRFVSVRFWYGDRICICDRHLFLYTEYDTLPMERYRLILKRRYSVAKKDYEDFVLPVHIAHVTKIKYSLKNESEVIPFGSKVHSKRSSNRVGCTYHVMSPPSLFQTALRYFVINSQVNSIV